MGQDRATSQAAADSRNSTLESFARRYTQVLVRFFTARVANRSEVADLVQDVYVRLSQLSDLGAIEKPEQYIFATAASALRDRLRRDAVRQRQSHESFDEAGHGRSELSPERVFAGRQAVYRLRDAVHELPERTRDVFILRVFEELKMAEIARTLGISQRAVEKHYAKAIAHVTERLRGYGRD